MLGQASDKRRISLPEWKRKLDAVRIQKEDMNKLIMNFLVMPIYFLSGALFPLTGQGMILGYVTKLDPLAYGIDGMRNVFGSKLAAFDPRLDLAVLLVVGFVLLIFGAYRFNKIEI